MTMLLAHQRLRAGFAPAQPPARRSSALPASPSSSPPTRGAADAAAPATATAAATTAAAATTTTRRASLLASLAAAAATTFAIPGVSRAATGKGAAEGAARVGAKYVHTEDEWRRIVAGGVDALGGSGARGEPGADFRYKVLRYASTERPFSSALYKEARKGSFVCAGCGSPVYRSEAKYDSGTGWPSFFEAVDGAVETNTDDSIPFMVRDELRCSACAGHLGHVFNDGPPPTGERHCINGGAMRFRPDDAAERRPGDDDGEAQLAIVSRMA